MSLSYHLRKRTLLVLADLIGLENLTEEDFAFVEMVAAYGVQRASGVSFAEAARSTVRRTNIASGETHTLQTGPAMPTGAPGPWDGLPGEQDWGADVAGQQPNAAEEHDNQQMLDLDQGADPQGVAAVLDTRPKAPLGSGDATQGGTADAPDYSKLAQR